MLENANYYAFLVPNAFFSALYFAKRTNIYNENTQTFLLFFKFSNV